MCTEGCNWQICWHSQIGLRWIPAIELADFGNGIILVGNLATEWNANDLNAPFYHTVPNKFNCRVWFQDSKNSTQSCTSRVIRACAQQPPVCTKSLFLSWEAQSLDPHATLRLIEYPSKPWYEKNTWFATAEVHMSSVSILNGLNLFTF